jgi:PAS domain S-box-containing protein
MNPHIRKLLCPLHIEYLAINQDFNIVETSMGVQRFADRPDQVREGKNVTIGFPELIGLEEILIAILEGQEAGFELKGIGRLSAQGTLLYIDIYILKNQYEENLENKLIIFFEDVTEKMVLEQILVQRSNEASLLLDAWAASNDYLDKIITSMAEALLVTTQSGIIKTVNRATKDLFGYNEEELIGKPISFLLSEETLLSAASQKYLLFHEFLNNVEVICQTKTGENVAIAFSCSAIQTDLEKLQYFIYIARNISDRPHIQKRLAAPSPSTRTNLSGAELSGSNLSGSNLSGADLSGANLSGADLSGANLSSTDLSGANLTHTDLRGANLSHADLSSTDLEHALFGDNLGISEEIKLALKQRGAIFEDSTGNL